MTRAFACITDSPHIRPRKGNGHLQVVPRSLIGDVTLAHIKKNVNPILVKSKIMEKKSQKSKQIVKHGLSKQQFHKILDRASQPIKKSDQEKS